MESLAARHRLLADAGRLRILRLLLSAPALNVGELVAILGLSQSGVSQKLGELKRAGLVQERREGGFAFYELAAGADAALGTEAGELRQAPDEAGDLARLAEALRARAERGEGGDPMAEPGRSWVAWARALGFLIPPLKVADLGCGDGALTCEVAAWARSVDAVDHSARAIARARARARRRGLDNVNFHRADVGALPLPDLSLPAGSYDLVLLSHLLHFLPDPEKGLAGAAGLLAPRGRLLLLELAPHDQEWVRGQLGHHSLGFPPERLEKWLAGLGLDRVTVELAGPRAAREPFRVLIATGEKA